MEIIFVLGLLIWWLIGFSSFVWYIVTIDNDDFIIWDLIMGIFIGFFGLIFFIIAVLPNIIEIKLPNNGVIIKKRNNNG